MLYFTYVLRSSVDNNLYIGWTDNLNARLEKHNKGLVEATKPRRPLDIVYYEACIDKRKAIAREKYFKTGFRRKYLKNRL